MDIQKTPKNEPRVFEMTGDVFFIEFLLRKKCLTFVNYLYFCTVFLSSPNIIDTYSEK